MNHPTRSAKDEQLQDSEYLSVMPHILQRLTKVDTQLDYLVKDTATKEDFADLNNCISGIGNNITGLTGDVASLKDSITNLRNSVLAIVGGGIILLLTICWLAML